MRAMLGMRVLGVRAGITVCACACVCSGVGAPRAQAAETGSQTFTVAGEHPFVVPAGVTSVQAALVGGNGGAGFGGALGGTAATVTATLAVTPGETLYAEVAGDGEPASAVNNLGGYGGGGAGGERAFGGLGGGGGGGASDLRTCPAGAAPSACAGHPSLASRLIVAGGGGGGGGTGFAPSSTAGGAGGAADQSGTTGQTDAHGDVGGGRGLRATLSAGGEAGAPSGECNPETGAFCAAPGQLGVGGVGGSSFGGGGGGGGGGVFGGGGGGGGAFQIIEMSNPANGGGGGAGGGASGVPAGASGVSSFSLVPTATGAEPSIAMSWTMPPPAAVTGAASAVTSTGATLTGTVNPDGSQVTECHFTVVPAPPGGASIPCQQQVGAGSVPVAVSAAIAGLTPATTYAVTLTASSAQGSASGSPVSFVTSASGAGGVTAASSLTVTNVKLSPTRFRRGGRAATIAKSTGKTLPTVTTISFALSQAATVKLSFEAARAGVLVAHKCIALGKTHRKGKRCTRYAPIPHGVSRSAHAGTDRITFDGVLDGGSRLAPGSYRLSVTASTASASATAAQHPAFTLL